MKIRYNRFAVFPVMCHDCHRYIWMEPYRRADVWHNLLDIDGWDCWGNEV